MYRSTFKLPSFRTRDLPKGCSSNCVIPYADIECKQTKSGLLGTSRHVHCHQNTAEPDSSEKDDIVSLLHPTLSFCAPDTPLIMMHCKESRSNSCRAPTLLRTSSHLTGGYLACFKHVMATNGPRCGCTVLQGPTSGLCLSTSWVNHGRT
ncbi:hypothetical protein TNCV_213301 [Trichonephila clavipes]|nr:hypothetical protein TNCV_213301 [Trichonephila clavipes]